MNLTLVHWVHFLFWVAAGTATLLPIAYAFVPWYKTTVGRVLMLHAIALALALDISLVFRYWKTANVNLELWIYTMIIGLVAVATSALAFLFARSQFGKSKVNLPLEYDGEMTVRETDGKKIYSLTLYSDPEKLDQKSEVVFKVTPS